MDPLAGIHAAVTRQTADGTPRDGWYPDERLKVEHALRHYTSGPAAAAGEARRAGKIVQGQFGDFIVLSGDPRSLRHSHELLALKLMMTGVAGEVVYQA
jgi:predicted amidohydrolase YtcJ